MSRSYLLAIDQGTTSTRSIVYDQSLKPLAIAQREIRQIYPAPGHVEHDPEEIWTTAVETMRSAVDQAGIAVKDIAGIGITNQRETTVLWDRATGRPIQNAIVWQDRRTADRCDALRQRGLTGMVTEKTGLLIDPYFSATKIAWLLEHVEGARAAAEAGQLVFGTIDTFLLWRLSGGRVHATDATNASRSLLFNINDGRWDADLLSLFGIPPSLLPEVRDSAADFATSEPGLLGAAVPIRGIAGDQQASAIGQGCFRPGMTKATYGTGCFALMNTGAKPVASRNRLLATIAYQLDGRCTYALEGAIFVAGAAVQWLRDALGLIARADETDTLAAAAHPHEEVYLVPAFVGLGAPWWDANARGAIFGLTRNSGRAELARAALEAVGYQTRELLAAMHADWQTPEPSATVLRVDGGLSASNYAMQFLADMTGAPVDRAVVQETTALGAAYLAGRCAGVCPDLEDFAKAWRAERQFVPAMDARRRAQKWQGWQAAVGRVVQG